MKWIFAVLLAAAAPGAAAMQGRSGGDPVTIKAARFYRGDRTLVDAFVQVPHQLLSDVTLGPGGFAAFSVELTVSDRQGVVLTRERWTRRVPGEAARVPGSATVEPVSFALAPGGYEIRAVVQDSASGRQATATLGIEGYGARPRASDLLLAPSIRRAAATDTADQAGEVRKGDLLITVAPEVVLTPSQASLYYYCEVYRDSAGSVPWQVRVAGEDGRAVVTTPPSDAQVAPGGGLLSGAVQLAGLPPGRYAMTLVVGAGPDSAARSASFRMGSLELERRVATVGGAAGGAADAGPFARMTEAELDTVFAPLLYLGSRSELGAYEGLTVEGKRRFLEQFWRQRDPTPGTPANEAQADFYHRIAEANRRFREGGAAEIPGWRTDRGRIFAAHGEPSDMLRRPSTGPSLPWEAWKYTQTRPRKYVFLDETGLGHYVLIYTDDPKERSFPGWERRIGEEGVQEVMRF